MLVSAHGMFQHPAGDPTRLRKVRRAGDASSAGGAAGGAGTTFKWQWLGDYGWEDQGADVSVAMEKALAARMPMAVVQIRGANCHIDLKGMTQNRATSIQQPEFLCLWIICRQFPWQTHRRQLIAQRRIRRVADA